jgi:uncharacterized protein GlcG (DUF336 family)
MSRSACHAGAMVVASAVGCVFAPAADAQLKAEKVLSYEAAKIIATTAVEACQAKGFHVSATVVNRDGDTIVQLRGDEARPHTVENSRRKAYTANTFRTDTAVYAKRLNDGDPASRPFRYIDRGPIGLEHVRQAGKSGRQLSRTRCQPG